MILTKLEEHGSFNNCRRGTGHIQYLRDRTTIQSSKPVVRTEADGNEEALDSSLETVGQRVDGVLSRSEGQRVDDSVRSVLDEHCLDELHFKLIGDELDFLRLQIERIIVHLVNGEPVAMDRDIDGHFVVTAGGQIVDSSDPMVRSRGRREHRHYGSCSMITELMDRMKAEGLIHSVSTDGVDRVRHDAMTAVFSPSTRKTPSDSMQKMWSEQFAEMFPEHSGSEMAANRDVVTLIGASSEEAGYGVQSVHIMVHHLLHRHCAAVLEHLGGPFPRTTFIEAVTTNLMKREGVEFGHDELPMVDRDGAIFIGQRPVRYDRYDDGYGYGYGDDYGYGYDYGYGGGYGSGGGHLAGSDSADYESCPFLTKLMLRPFGSIEEQIRSALGSFHEGGRGAVYDEKMAVLLEQHCPDSVVVMEQNMVFWSSFNDRFSGFVDDAVSARTISMDQRYAVNVDDGHIVAVDAQNDRGRNLMDCPLINRIVEMFGIDHRIESDPDSDQSDAAADPTQSEDDRVILEMDQTVKDMASSSICASTECLDDKEPEKPIPIELTEDGVASDPKGRADAEMVDLAKMIWADLNRFDAESGDIAAEFDEDVQFGLNSFCKEVMDRLSSFEKRRLRRDIMSKVLLQKTKMEHPVVTSGGDVLSFDDVPSDETPFWKCPFIEALVEQM